MCEDLICQHGHHWKPPRGDAAVQGTTPHCPICGSTVAGPVEDTLDRWQEVIQQSPAGSKDSEMAAKEELPQTMVGRPSHDRAFVPPSLYPSVPGYEILEELGRGGMGVVYKARHLALRRLVALKMILAGGHASRQDRNRFRGEAQAFAALQHPNIIQLYEVGEHDGLPFFSMEIVDGGSLKQKTRGTPLPAREAAALIEKLARAMHYAHQQGVIHRDLKPANVLLTADGEPKITDFGLAKRLQEDSHQTEAAATRTGDAIGTPSYMAPEQAAGQGKRVGPLADVYSLGAMLYELLTGRPPFLAETVLETLSLVLSEEPASPSRVQPHLPRDLVTICLKCLRKEPLGRYGSAGELADDLRRFLQNEPIRAVPVGGWQRLVKWARRNPAWAALWAVSVLALLVLLGGGIVYNVQLNRALARTNVERHQALSRLQRLDIHSGMDFVESGRLPMSLPLFVEALALARTLNEDDSDRDLALRMERMHRIRLAAVLGDCPRLLRAWFHHGPVLDAAFSRDGRLVVTAGTDDLACVWDIASGERAGPPLRHDAPVFRASFSSDANRVLTASADRTARIWEVPSGREVCRAPRHRGDVVAAAFSPDGRWFCTASADGTARVCDARTGRERFPALAHHEGQSPIPLRDAAFSPDGRLLVTLSAQSARLWCAELGTSAGPELRHKGKKMLAAAFNPDGTLLATGGEDKRARLWEVASGRQHGPTLEHKGTVVAVSFSPDRKWLATGCDDGTVHIWPAAGGEPIDSLARRDRVECLNWSADGRSVVVGSGDNTATVWLVKKGVLGHAMTANGNVTRVSFSPDGHFVLGASMSGVVRLWRPVAAFRAPVAKRRLVYGPVRAVSADGRREVVTLDRLTLQVRDARTSEPLGQPFKPGRIVCAAVFDPTGNRLLLMSIDGNAQICEALTGRPLIAALVHASPVSCGAFSADGKRVVTGSFDNTTRVWDAQTAEPVTPFMNHHGSVYRVGFSPDGHCVLSASEDGVARVWDANTGLPLTPPLDPEGWARHALDRPADPAAWRLPIDNRPIEEIKVEAEWLSGHHIDKRIGGLLPNSVQRLQRLGDLMRTRYPKLLDLSP
jgi:WD40 repeat protein